MTQGSNGGPPDVPLTAKTKLECIKGIIERADLTSPQKCIGVGIVLSADREWAAEVKTDTLKQFASAKDRETVFRATKALDEKAIISKANQRGQSGRYLVVPPSVVSAIIEAYDELKTSRAKPDGTTSQVPTGNAVGFDLTSPVEPVGFDPTSRAPAPAQYETPSGLVKPLENRTNPPLSPYDEPRVSFEKGQITLFNGLKQYWLDEFLGDEKRLDLALKQAAGYVQPNSIKPLEAQVSSQLAQIVARRLDQDDRYLKAAKTNSKQADTTEPKHKRYGRKLAEIAEAKR